MCAAGPRCRVTAVNTSHRRKTFVLSAGVRRAQRACNALCERARVLSMLRCSAPGLMPQTTLQRSLIGMAGIALLEAFRSGFATSPMGRIKHGGCVRWKAAFYGFVMLFCCYFPLRAPHTHINHAFRFTTSLHGFCHGSRRSRHGCSSAQGPLFGPVPSTQA